MKLLRYLEFTLIGSVPTPTYLSHFIGHVYVFTIPVYICKMLFLLSLL